MGRFSGGDIRQVVKGSGIADKAKIEQLTYNLKTISKDERFHLVRGAETSLRKLVASLSPDERKKLMDGAAQVYEEKKGRSSFYKFFLKPDKAQALLKTLEHSANSQ